MALVDPDQKKNFESFDSDIEVMFVKKMIDMDVKNFNSFHDLYQFMNEEFGSEFKNIDTEEDSEDDEYAIILNDDEI